MIEMTKVQVVKKYILEEINAGRIARGQRLPSCREVAALLNVNKITVNKAYAQLEEEHEVYSIPRGGFYLVDCRDKSSVVKKQIDFSIVKPDEKLIPYREFTHVINKAIDIYKSNLFIYEQNFEPSNLKETLKLHLEREGIYTSSEDIIITNGAQQGISLVLQAVFHNNNRKLLVEVPSYNLVLKLAKYLGIEMLGIERKNNGYDFKKMEEILKNEDIAAFYIIPRHHNPTGYSLTEVEKKKIVELCNKYNILIIEDDYLSELVDKKTSMPIYYYDISRCTVYVKSFSKTFMPGIRIGAIILPKYLVNEIAKFKYLSDLNTSKIPQVALDLFIKSGMYEKHIKKVRKSYENKLRKASEIFKSLSPQELIWHVPENGIFIWLVLPEYVKASTLEKELKAKDIIIDSDNKFFLDDIMEKEDYQNYHNCVRLCISGIAYENIRAIETIITTIKNLGFNN